MYEATVKWDSQQSRQAFPVASLELKPIATASPKAMYQRTDSINGAQGGEYSAHFLTHLEFAPAYGYMESTGANSGSPLLIGVYSTWTHPSDEIIQQASPASVIVRWRVDLIKETLLPVFDEILKKETNLKARAELVRMEDDLASPRIVVALDYLEAMNAVAVMYDDNSIAMLDPKTLRPCYTGDHNSITSLAQAGFQYPVAIGEFGARRSL